MDVASLLDWDLETQVYPIVRWLVHHRRAKIVDMVHRGLKTVFSLPYKIESLYAPDLFIILCSLTSRLASKTLRESSERLSLIHPSLHCRSYSLPFPELRQTTFTRRW